MSNYAKKSQAKNHKVYLIPAVIHLYQIEQRNVFLIYVRVIPKDSWIKLNFRFSNKLRKEIINVI